VPRRPPAADPPDATRAPIHESELLLRAHPAGHGIEENPLFHPNVFWKQFLQPLRLNRGGQERMVFISLSGPSTSRTSAATSSGLSCTMLSRASRPRRPCTNSHRRVPESSRRATRSEKPVRMHFCTASSGTSDASVSSPSTLAIRRNWLKEPGPPVGGEGVDAQAAARLDAVAVLQRVIPRAHQDPEIRGRPVAQQVLAERLGFAAGVAEEEVSALGQGGDQRRLPDATVILGRQQHAGVPGMQRKRQHLATDVANGRGPRR